MTKWERYCHKDRNGCSLLMSNYAEVVQHLPRELLSSPMLEITQNISRSEQVGIEPFRNAFKALPTAFRLCSAAVFSYFLVSLNAQAQAVQPFVDHWDAKKTIKKSEGLFVSGREWGEWKFYDPDGKLMEMAEFKSGERDGHVKIYYPNGVVEHDGWFKRGVLDSVRTSRYRSGDIMEQGHYRNGNKIGAWSYFYPDSMPMLREAWQDTLMLVTDAWDSSGVQTIKEGSGILRNYYGSGSIQEESTYTYGVRSGPFAEYYPAGNPRAKGAYQAV